LTTEQLPLAFIHFFYTVYEYLLLGEISISNFQTQFLSRLLHLCLILSAFFVAKDRITGQIILPDSLVRIRQIGIFVSD